MAVTIRSLADCIIETPALKSFSSDCTGLQMREAFWLHAGPASTTDALQRQQKAENQRQ